MKFGYTIFYVKDVQKTLELYEKAFGFKIKFITPENDYGELISGETTLSFASQELGKANFGSDFQPASIKEQPYSMEIAFVTENIKEDFNKAIAAGALEYKGIEEKPWGQKVGYLKDHNGIIIEICTAITGQ
ncbi:VOC family protein [Cyclobacterium sp. 1_MG-2023]|uniref:VOC family protein n=1 Tax=Cyclobacterium sp. 1_MG-2023 TaxID=3062681 RepID=UPI0026E396D0|nr:VOC family protein [Cyclobacterium sp. 1_MG-2023]MDO6438046.1 VOC family protein [Cyclobacterium sp. 1_MG-2023]